MSEPEPTKAEIAHAIYDAANCEDRDYDSAHGWMIHKTPVHELAEAVLVVLKRADLPPPAASSPAPEPWPEGFGTRTSASSPAPAPSLDSLQDDSRGRASKPITHHPRHTSVVCNLCGRPFESQDSKCG